MSNKPHIILTPPISYIKATITVGHERTETKDLEVKVAIERTFLGWLCAATGLTPKVAMCHLYDLCALPLENLLERNGTWVSRKVDFPNSNIKLKVVCGRFHDRDAFYKDVRKWEDACKAAGLKPYENTNPYRAWCAANPRPQEDWQSTTYNYVKCKFSIVGQEKEIIVSQHDMEHLVTETLLLGDDDEQG